MTADRHISAAVTDRDGTVIAACCVGALLRVLLALVVMSGSASTVSQASESAWRLSPFSFWAHLPISSQSR